MIYRAVISKPRTASSSVQPVSGTRNYRSGFLGRLSDTLVGTSSGNSSIAFTDALPLALEGRATVPPLAQERR